MNDCCQHAANAGIGSLSLALLFTTGLLMSLGHCIGMCGPIVGAFSVGQKARGATPRALVLATGLYQGGRVMSYVLIGGFFGLLGSGASRLGDTGLLKGLVSILAAGLMLILGIGLLGILPSQHWLDRLPFARRASQAIARFLRTPKPIGQIGLGLANGFLPCGPVAAAALTAAAAASVPRGMLAMLAYGLGTVPILFALSLGMGALGRAVRLRFYRMGAVLVLLIGVQLGLRGFHGLGWIEGMRIGEMVLW
jgi:sulfite exporter TauE/SafE